MGYGSNGILTDKSVNMYLKTIPYIEMLMD